MKPLSKMYRPLSSLFFLMGMTAFACGPLQLGPGATVVAPPGQPSAEQPSAEATSDPGFSPTETVELNLPSATESLPEPVPTPTIASASPAPYSLDVHKSYQLFPDRMLIGASLAARPGKVWIGSISGIIETLDTQSGSFGQSLSLDPSSSEDSLAAFPVLQLEWEGQYLWALASQMDMGEHPYLLAIDGGSGRIVHQWDLDSSEWTGGEERLFGGVEAFGISPGKIWVDNHIIDTQTFEITPAIDMPSIALFAFNGKDWMWMTGENGGACDDLLLVNTQDPANVNCPDEWPFLAHTPDGITAVGPGSPMVMAGERMWIGGGWSGAVPTYALEAYWADLYQAMTETEPLASVPLLDTDSSIKMLYAGKSLWVIYTLGDKAGLLYQLDPVNGETLNHLDLVGDQGRSISDIPMDIVSEGDNLWVLTARQLFQIKLP